MKTMSRILTAAAVSGALAAMAGCSAQVGQEQTGSDEQAAICTNCGTGSSSGSSSSGGSSSGGIVVKKADGAACTAATQCSGAVCSDGVCTSSCTNWSQCPSGWGCGSSGLCAPATAQQCAPAPALSNAGGACATNLDCNANLLCESGTCTSFPAAACTTSAQCTLGSSCVSGKCQSTIAGGWSGWTYTTTNVPVLECPSNSPACNVELFPSKYLVSGQCPAGLTCMALTANGNAEYGCFDLASQPSGIPTGAASCTASNQCPSGQGCWMATGATVGSCITPCDGQVAQTNTLQYAPGQINPPTIGLALVGTIATVTPAHAGASAPTARMIAPPCPMTPSPNEDQIDQVAAVQWADTQNTNYAPAKTFSGRLQAAGCQTPSLLWGTGLADNYVYFAQCPANTTIDAIVNAAACDSVINAIEFSSVSCQLDDYGLILSPTVPYPAVSGSVYVEWDPHGSCGSCVVAN